MHSRIIQLRTSQVDKLDYIEDYSVPEWFEFEIADYVAESNREEDLEWISDEFSGYTHANFDEKGVLTIHDLEAFQAEYFERRFFELQKEVANMTLKDFADSMNAYRISKLIKDRLGFYIYFDDGGAQELMPIDEFVRSLNYRDRKTYYVGGTLDYQY